MNDNISNLVRSETASVCRFGAVTESNPAPGQSMDAANCVQTVSGSNLVLISFDLDREPLGTFIIPTDWRTSPTSLLKAALPSGLKPDGMSALLVHNAQEDDIETHRDVSDLAQMLRHGFGRLDISMKNPITIPSDGAVHTIS